MCRKNLIFTSIFLIIAVCVSKCLFLLSELTGFFRYAPVILSLASGGLFSGARPPSIPEALFAIAYLAWCALQDSNLRPTECNSVALPAELSAHMKQHISFTIAMPDENPKSLHTNPGAVFMVSPN